MFDRKGWHASIRRAKRWSRDKGKSPFEAPRPDFHALEMPQERLMSLQPLSWPFTHTVATHSKEAAIALTARVRNVSNIPDNIYTDLFNSFLE